MPRTRTLVTTFTLNKAFCADHLKLCYLWYDEVICEHLIGDFKDYFINRVLDDKTLTSSEVNELTDVVVPYDQRLSKDIQRLAKTLNDPSKPRGYPRWGTREDPYENYSYPSPGNAEEYAHNALLQKIHTEHGVVSYRDVRAEHVEGRARVAVDAVTLWKITNQEMECMLQANDDEKVAMRAFREFELPRGESPVEAFKLFEVSIPSLIQVPWKKIVQLRRLGKFESLRERIAQALKSASGNLEIGREELQRAEEAAVSEIIEQYRPNVKKVIAESLWANIPNIPFFNPVAAYFDARDLAQEVKKAQDLNWFYLLRDIRESTRETAER